MIPLVGIYKELENQVKVVNDVAAKVMADEQITFEYSAGTMIEIPRAAITANEIAEVADFFSFGTNDLTQMAFGLSRDDSSKFLPFYVSHDILPYDPFVSIDSGVAELVRIAVEKGRSVKHGGDPLTINFCHKVGLDYVSCSPFRLPIARLAAAQAALGDAVPAKKAKASKKQAKKQLKKKAAKKTRGSKKK
jgi:pyruvate,orthophosphate dikinase